MASDRPTIYHWGEHAEVLSTLLADARASLGQIAERTGSYRQKVWREVQALDGDLIWGYGATVDEQRLGWRRYTVLLKVSRASQDFLQQWRDVQAHVDQDPSIRLADAHIITGIDYNFMLEITCQNRLEMQAFLDRIQDRLETVLERPPRAIEAVYTLRLNGFSNPDEPSLENLIEDMGIVKPAVTAN